MKPNLYLLRKPKVISFNMEYINQIENKIEKLIGRKVNFYLSSKFNPNQNHIVLYETI